jgi:uncharacterized protein (DUF1778 family)
VGAETLWAIKRAANALKMTEKRFVLEALRAQGVVIAAIDLTGVAAFQLVGLPSARGTGTQPVQDEGAAAPARLAVRVDKETLWAVKRAANALRMTEKRFVLEALRAQGVVIAAIDLTGVAAFQLVGLGPEGAGGLQVAHPGGVRAALCLPSASGRGTQPVQEEGAAAPQTGAAAELRPVPPPAPAPAPPGEQLAGLVEPGPADDEQAYLEECARDNARGERAFDTALAQGGKVTDRGAPDADGLAEAEVASIELGISRLVEGRALRGVGAADALVALGAERVDHVLDAVRGRARPALAVAQAVGQPVGWAIDALAWLHLAGRVTIHRDTSGHETFSALPAEPRLLASVTTCARCGAEIIWGPSTTIAERLSRTCGGCASAVASAEPEPARKG